MSFLQQLVLGVVFCSLQAQRRTEEQDPEGLVEELRATGTGQAAEKNNSQDQLRTPLDGASAIFTPTPCYQ